MKHLRPAFASLRTRPDSAQPLILARGLSKTYDTAGADRVTAVKNVDCEIYDDIIGWKL